MARIERKVGLNEDGIFIPTNLCLYIERTCFFSNPYKHWSTDIRAHLQEDQLDFLITNIDELIIFNRLTKKELETNIFCNRLSSHSIIHLKESLKYYSKIIYKIKQNKSNAILYLRDENTNIKNIIKKLLNE